MTNLVSHSHLYTAVTYNSCYKALHNAFYATGQMYVLNHSRLNACYTSVPFSIYFIRKGRDR